jgi:glutaredoxin
VGGVSYPLLSDFWPHGAVAQRYGVFRSAEGHSERALFVIGKQGSVCYADVHDIDQQPDNEEIFRVLRELEPNAVRLPRAEGAAPPVPAVAVAGPPPIVLYCRPGCIDCRLARRFLEHAGLAYREIDVRADPQAEARVRQWTGGALVSPVFDIGGKIVIDFKRDELERALGLR